MTTITEKTTTTTSEKSSMDVVKEQASHVADEMGKAAHQIGETPAAKKVAETGKNAQAKASEKLDQLKATPAAKAVAAKVDEVKTKVIG